MQELDKLLEILKESAPVLDGFEEKLYTSLSQEYSEETDSLLFARDIAYLRGATDMLTMNVDSLEANIVAALIRFSSIKED